MSSERKHWIDYCALGISILAAIFAWWNGCSARKANILTQESNKTTQEQVSLYRKDLSLQYSPVISTRIITLRDINDPQIAIFNFSDKVTQITSYEIIFTSTNPKEGEKAITKDDLDKDLIGEELPPKTESFFYFNNTGPKQPLVDFLRGNENSEKTKILCKGYIEVKNSMKPDKKRMVPFKCARWYDSTDSNKTLFWYTDPGPKYMQP